MANGMAVKVGKLGFLCFGVMPLMLSQTVFAVDATSSTTSVKNATDTENFGLFPAANFRQVSGNCSDCATIKQGLWYFRDDVLAVPKADFPIAGYSKTLENVQDITQWASTPDAKNLAYPPLVWLGAPQVIESGNLTADGKQIKTPGGELFNFQVVPKIATNRSYYNDATTAFFGTRQVRVRGTLQQADGNSTFVARSIWPKDFTIDQSTLKSAPLTQNDTIKTFVQAEQGGAKSPFSTRLIWERHPGEARQWQGKTVLGFMLNGAQGDDDESYGGHFGIVTGKYGSSDDWSGWLVNNFYNLDSVSEKGIISAMVPMDNYLMDLNSGQQYYRPSYMLVAVLNNGRTAELYQGAVQRTYNHFYRHDFIYQHAAANCAGISLDVFKALGWQIPEQGPTGRLKAIGAYGYVSAKEMSMTSGRKIYDYLTEEQTHLLPAVAFDAAGNDLLSLVGATPVESGRVLTDYEKQLQSDIDALILVRIPQVPSSRVFGSNPVFSFDEYMQRAPQDHSKWQIVPVDARPFPTELRDGLALQQKPASVAVPFPVIALVAGLIFIVGAIVRRRKNRQEQEKQNIK